MSSLTPETDETVVRMRRLHRGQRQCVEERSRFNALVCGRRWGKTTLLVWLAARAAWRGRYVGWFAATYKILDDAFRDVQKTLAPVIARSNRTEKRLELITGGVLEFWTLEDPDAGRSRRYHLAMVDEAGLVKDLETILMEAIRPTLMDYQGAMWLAGTPKGRNYFATAYALGQDPLVREWASWRMPTWTNPSIPKSEIEVARAGMPDRSFRQEICAEFMEDAGGVFLGVRGVVDAGRTISQQQPTDTVYVGIDLARTIDYTVVTVVGDRMGSIIQHEAHRWNRCPWQQTVERIVGIVQRVRPRLVVVDATGVGDPIAEALSARLGGWVRVEPFKFTADSKRQAIDALAQAIETERIRLLDDPVQTEELVSYEYQPTQGGSIRTGAPVGLHDDMVMALALACWPLRDRRSRVVFGLD